MRRVWRFLRWPIAALFLLLLWVLFWPPPEVVTAPAETALDLAMPAYHHFERHEVEACADPQMLDRAIREVRADEIRGFELLMGVREMRRQSNNAARQLPLMEAMRRMNFVPLANLPAQELVYGTAGPFWRLRGPRGEQAAALRAAMKQVEGDPPGFAALVLPDAAKAAIHFRIVHEVGAPCPKLVTETRIHCPDPESLREFTRYWRVIAPASGYLRRSWLEAIVRRANRPPA
jgi:hypothetical protein